MVCISLNCLNKSCTVGVLHIKLFAAGRWRTAVIALLLHGLPKGYIAGCVKSLLERTHYGISSMIIIKGKKMAVMSYIAVHTT